MEASPCPSQGGVTRTSRRRTFIKKKEYQSFFSAPLNFPSLGGVRGGRLLLYHLIQIQHEDTLGTNLLEALNLVPKLIGLDNGVQ